MKRVFVAILALYLISCFDRREDCDGLTIINNSEYNILFFYQDGEHLYNYCDEPAYDMNHLVLDCYKALGKTKTKLFHFYHAVRSTGDVIPQEKANFAH